MDRCGHCPGVHHCIPPDGPEDADILFIGEAPGKDENQKRRVFIGKTGDEVNRHYLPLAGLQRAGVRFTNAIRCLPASAGGKLDPQRRGDMDLLSSCAGRFLYPHLEHRRYRLIVPMGAFAIAAICPEVSLELQHGIPVETVWGIPAFPMYHPAGGIHEPKKMLQIRTDWSRLKQYLGGTLTVPVDDVETDYQEVTHVRELAELDPTRPLAADTESKRGGAPFAFTYSQYPGHGRFISAQRRDLLLQLSRYLEKWESSIAFHYWLHDWPVCEALGLRVPARKVVDTMVRSFHLGNLPQGLKALAFREVGMVMDDFMDVVTPHSGLRVLDYYTRASCLMWPKPEEELTQDDKTGLWKLYKPQSMNTKLKRFFTDCSKNPEKDVFGAWDNWESSQAMLERELGPWPGLCISHVPFAQALFYACRDADATLRVYYVLEAMRSMVRRASQELWRAA